MPARKLSTTEARDILLRSSSGLASHGAGWLTLDQKRALLKAIEARKEKFKFVANGAEFKIVYYSTDDLVFVGPVKGFVPCGWFLVSKLKDRIIEADGANVEATDE